MHSTLDLPPGGSFCLTPQAQREYGNKWRTIVDNYLPWRSPNDLKNYCNQYVNGKHNHVSPGPVCVIFAT